MAYKKDQGRYARMVAFWGIFLLLAWGCLRADGMVGTLRHWLGALQWRNLVQPWVDPFPLLGRLDFAMLVALVGLGVMGMIVFRILARPQVVDLLIETESELRKVTWPTSTETWRGTIAVVVTVAFLLLYLTGADFVILLLLRNAMGAG